MIAAIKLTAYNPGLRDRLERHLPAESLERAGRFVQEEDRLRCAGAELLKRAILSGCSGLPARDLSFREGPWGKPLLCNVEGLHFNLSHSGEWILMAAGEGPLGVDVERVSDPAPRVEEVVFSPAERAFLDASPAEERGRRFFDLWTRKESYIKALGMGFSAPLTSITVLPGEGWSRPQVDDDSLDADWKILQMDLDPGYSAALCARTAMEPVIRRYGWEALLDMVAGKGRPGRPDGDGA